VREAVITAERDRAALAQEITAMREKVRAAHPVRGGRFDVKHSPGGMVDVEFVVQYLVLAHSAEHPRAARQPGQHRAAAARRGRGPACCPAGRGQQAWRRPTPTASCAACSTAPAWTNTHGRKSTH
jgi:[glutamine synthetase] adenylyltransferase / [glutamine synthetase]-adenylyl-L-tyrosine phosphorylase